MRRPSRQLARAPLALALFGALLASRAFAQSTELDGFDQGLIRVVNGASTDPQTRLLWNQFEGDFSEGANVGTEEIVSSPVRTPSGSLKLTVEQGNLYLLFNPYDGSVWRYLRTFTTTGGAWPFNTFNRLRFWVLAPAGVRKEPGGGANLHVGTYVRKTTGAVTTPGDGGGQWFHYFNVPPTGEWHQVIVDWHPSNRPGGFISQEFGVQELPTGETGYNYFDLITRLHVDWRGTLPAYPAEFYVDAFELYREARPENLAQVYGLNATFVSATKELVVGWMRAKDDNAIRHEVRYAFEDIHTLGWANATPAPNGLVSPLGVQGLNGMEWSTRAIDLAGRSVVYVAIKPENAALFRQIAIPLNVSVPRKLAKPRNLRVVP